jgi:hypothetical protein
VIYHANANENTIVPTLLSEIVVFRIKVKLKLHKSALLKTIKGLILQELITNLNIYVPNNRAS